MAIRVKLIAGVLAVSLLGASPTKADTIGSNLASSPNDSVCEFRPEISSPGEVETRYCSVTQWILDEDYAAPGRLEAFFNGTVVGWSVVVGARSSNTGRITLALRTGKRGAPIYQGAEVLLPDVSPGSRVHFDENLPIEEGAQVILRIGITTRGNAEEAGAPLAFNVPGVGKTETFLGGAGEPWPPGGGLVETTENQALLLQAEIESTEDTTAPIARRRFAGRQDLGRGAVIQVRSNEAGGVRATARLKIAGRKQSFSVTSKRIRVRPNTWTSLRLPLRKAVARAVKAAEAEGRLVTLKGKVHVADGAGNSRALLFRVKGR